MELLESVGPRPRRAHLTLVPFVPVGERRWLQHIEGTYLCEWLILYQNHDARVQARWLVASGGFGAHGQLSGRGAGCFAFGFIHKQSICVLILRKKRMAPPFREEPPLAIRTVRFTPPRGIAQVSIANSRPLCVV
jgi:hypothetical protein